ncbi:MAG: hypothetical protein KF742_09105 [Cryobacterium sp.]|nr:hypothetical protein [Cryobacterium sp.]MBX3089577.1 hypothetical protein [Cryobacterium sp.]
MSRDNPRSSTGLVIGAPPKANLLPPEVGAMARGKVARRNAIALVILAVLVVIAGYAGAAVLASGAQAQLDAANDRTQSLLKEQLKYSEVSQVKNLLAAAEAAKQVGMSTEVDWKTYLDNIQKSLPAGTLVTNVVAEVATPLTDFAQPTVPLQGNRIGELTFTATSPSLPDVEAWLRALSKLDGYVDASPGSIALDNTSKLYQVSIKMHIDTGALWLRFDDTAREAKDKALEEKRAQQEKEEAEKQTPSPSPSPSEDDADGGA